MAVGMLTEGCPHWDRSTTSTKHLLNMCNEPDLRLGSGNKKEQTLLLWNVPLHCLFLPQSLQMLHTPHYPVQMPGPTQHLCAPASANNLFAPGLFTSSTQRVSTKGLMTVPRAEVSSLRTLSCEEERVFKFTHLEIEDHRVQETCPKAT